MHGLWFWTEFIAMRAFARKDLRGFGLYSYGLIYMLSQMKKKGFKQAFMDIETHNISSVNSTIKLGAIRSHSSYFHFHIFFVDYVLPQGELKSRFVKKTNRSLRV